MIETARVALAFYGALLIAGGIIGKVKAGSSASLFAGAVSGAIALVGFWQSLRDPAVGFLTGGLVGLLLTGIFMSRYIRTRKFMPAGLVLLLSLLVGILTMVARQEYMQKRDLPAGELTQKRPGILSPAPCLKDHRPKSGDPLRANRRHIEPPSDMRESTCDFEVRRNSSPAFPT